VAEVRRVVVEVSVPRVAIEFCRILSRSEGFWVGFGLGLSFTLALLGVAAR
jgi:hypothetical protein